jgi:uncharacterized protein with HEPN domain
MDNITELDSRQEDNLARLVWQNYLNGVLYRSTTLIGGKSLRMTMDECFDAAQGVLSTDEQEVADELCAVSLEFEAQKVRQAQAWISDLVSQSIGAPLLEPTNIPAVPEIIEQQTLTKIKQILFKQGFAGDLKELAGRVKAETTATHMGIVREAVKRCESEIRDKLEEADFRGEMNKVIRDFTVMPYAVLKGPVWHIKRVPAWNKNTFELTEKLTMGFERVNPYDFFWSTNAKSVADAAFVIERRWMSKHELVNSPNMLKKNLRMALQVLMSDSDWLSDHPERVPQPLISDATPVAVLEMHASVSARELFRYGVVVPGYNPDTAEGEFTAHEAIVGLLCHRVIYARLAPNDSPVERPYSVGCYEQHNDTIHGFGVVQRCRRVARVARSFLYASIRNAAASALPTGEMDAQRVAEYLPKDQWGQFLTGTIIPVSPDHSSGGRPAFYYHNVPNNVDKFLQAMQLFMSMLDTASGIPGVASGDMAGQATLGRSFRGLSLAIASASKGIKLPLLNLDRMVEQVVTRTYYYLQQYSPDESLKGDANIVARGSSGYLQKEARQSAVTESLQSAVVLAQSGIIPKEMLVDLVRQVFEDTVPDINRFFPDSAIADTAGGDSVAGPASSPAGLPGQSTSPGFGGASVAA